jgi:hypothetical protein
MLQRFETTNANRVATVFGVLSARVDRSCRPVAFRVQLPIRPNGSTGWVRASDVRLLTVHNLHQVIELVAGARRAIVEGRFARFREELAAEAAGAIN